MEQRNSLNQVVLLILLIVSSCKGGEFFPLADDIVLDVQNDITSAWTVQSTCNYQKNYTGYAEFPNHCAVTIDPGQDPELNSGYWSPCTYPSCEIIYTHSEPNEEDIPTSIKIRSYMHRRSDSQYPPKIIISRRATPDSLKTVVAELGPSDNWTEDSIPLQDLSQAAVR